MLVVELSSYQLHHLPKTGPGALHPWSSVVLNVADDHLDWHGSFDAYRAAKATVYENTQGRLRLQPRRRGDATHGRRRRGRGGRPRDRFRPRMSRGRATSASSTASSATVRSSTTGANAALELTIARRARTARPDRTRTSSRTSSPPRRWHGRSACRRRRSTTRSATSGSTRTASRPSPSPAASAGSTTPRRPTPTPRTRRCAAFGKVVWIVGGLLKGVDVDALVAAHAARLRAAIIIGVDRAALVGGVRATRARTARVRGDRGRH